MAKVKLNERQRGRGRLRGGQHRARSTFPEPGQLKIASAACWPRAGRRRRIKQLAPGGGVLRAVQGRARRLVDGARAASSSTPTTASGATAEADALAAELGRLGGTVPPEVAAGRHDPARVASLERGGKHQDALALLEPIAKDENAPPQIPARSLADAWAPPTSRWAATKPRCSPTCTCRCTSRTARFVHGPGPARQRGSLRPSSTTRTRARDSLQQLLKCLPQRPRGRRGQGPTPETQRRQGQRRAEKLKLRAG